MDHIEPVHQLFPVETLTDREQEVLRLMAQDLSAQEMADRLYLSPTTIKWYAQQIYGKLGIHESGQKRRLAVARARTLGLLEPDRTPAGRLRYNLPVQTTPLIGRTRELHDIASLLANPEIRLVTLLGPGGMGKTRLALEVAWRLVEPEAFEAAGIAFPDGVYFTPLQPIDAAEDIPWAVAEAVGYQFHGDGRTPLRQLLDFFREKHLLLVLDNFEHVLEGATLVSDILQAAPGVQALVTSRETLNLTAETVYALEGLPFPAWQPSDDTPVYDAARLFVQAARRAQAGFELRADEQLPLARICQLVQGMPLAILLAAAWVEVLSLPEIAEEIARSFDFLEAEMRDAPPRQWSIRAVFEPTWQRLDAEEQSVFMRLAVFRGGCTRQAAQAVTGTSLPILQRLVNKAVLTRTPKGRYDIHELLRQYALERSAAAHETEDAQDAHCAYYAEFMQAREADLKGGDRQIAALDEIEAEFGNVRAVWDWAIARHRTDDLARMKWAVWQFLVIRGRSTEGLALFHSALGLEEDRPLHGRVTGVYGRFCYLVGRNREAEEWARQSLVIARETGNRTDLARALSEMAFSAADSSRDFEQAHRMIDESLALYRELGDIWGLTVGLHIKGVVAGDEGDYPSALSFTEEALGLARTIGDRHRIAAGLLNSGLYYSYLGELEQALRCYEESLVLFRELNAPGGMAIALGNMGSIGKDLGDYASALQRLDEGLILATECGNRYLVGSILTNVVNILSLTDRMDEAVERLEECWRVTQSIEHETLEARVHLRRAMLAYRRGDDVEAQCWAQVALEYAQVHHISVQESYSGMLLALIEIRLGHLDSAHEHLRAALIGPLARDVLMQGVYGMATLAAASEQPERAAELAALAQNHRATAHEFKVYSAELLAELQVTLPSEVYAAAVERGATLDPDAVVAAWLEEGEA